MRLYPQNKKRIFNYFAFFLSLLLVSDSIYGQLVTPTTTTSVSGFNTHVLENLNSYNGTSSNAGITSWDLRGTDTRGNSGNGTNQSGGTSGGWYGNSNISFLGTGTAENGNATLRLRNTTGSTITAFRVVYTARQWRSGSASPSVSVSWSTSASSSIPSIGALTNSLSSLGFNDATSGITSGVSLAQTVTSASISDDNYIFLRWIHPGNSNGDNLGWDDIYFIPRPITQASAINFTSVTTSGMTVNWTNGNGRRRAVFVKSGSGTITNPTDGTSYTANSTLGSGTQLGTSGYYCVYDGTGTSVAVTGLSASTTYYVQVFEYNSDASPTAITKTYLTTVVSANQTTSSLCSTPTAFNVTGGGSYCAGGSGVAVGLSNSQTSVNYQLYNGAATVGSPVAGTGSSISFGNQTAAATYTVLATTATGGCTNAMTGSAVVTINSLPSISFTPTTPSYCEGGSGVGVTASGASTYIWSPATGLSATTGATVTATPTFTTTYTVTGTNASGCTDDGTVTVTVNPLPTTTIIGDATIPTSGSAVLTFTGIDGDEVFYWNGTSTVSTIIGASGTSTVSVSPAVTTTYSVTSATSAFGCSQSITGQTATVTVSTDPTATVSGTATICPGTSTNLVFSGTAAATVYYSTDGVTPLNVTLSGVSGIGTFTLSVTPSVTTTYTLDSIVSCSYQGTLTGSRTVTLYSSPSIFNVTGSGSYCAGGTGVSIGLSNSQSGVDYQLYDGASTVGSPVAGTGSAISLGSLTTATT